MKFRLVAVSEQNYQEGIKRIAQDFGSIQFSRPIYVAHRQSIPTFLWAVQKVLMKTPAENMTALTNSPEYKDARASYTNAFKNGAGRQKPGTAGFALWLLYDLHSRNHHKKPPSKRVALELAKAHGLNETSAANALLKWSAFHGFIKPRTGAYAQGPRS